MHTVRHACAVFRMAAVRQAREAIHQNPAGALAPVPMAHLPHLWLALDRQQSREVRGLGFQGVGTFG